MIATAIAVAFVVYSCGGKLSEAEQLNLSETPVQIVENMFFIDYFRKVCLSMPTLILMFWRQ